ncbi:hypothetical protein FLAG1_12058 [Fusarium langsethiae]|uniref:Uncharacterized protein n=1 Tax=Fusarium langsethiae TaxID=179993 RepID=A0A0N0V4J1_FUSLA|nr:hypothetical protein FLAG1_12058 [Fusarium langsethiae]
MSYHKTLPRNPTVAGSNSPVGTTACENYPKLITFDFDLIRAASQGLVCMSDDLINHYAPVSDTEILETLEEMELLLGLLRHGVRS